MDARSTSTSFRCKVCVMVIDAPNHCDAGSYSTMMFEPGEIALLVSSSIMGILGKVDSDKQDPNWV